MFYFAHSGKIGDLIYSLNFCKEVAENSEEKKINFHVYTNLLYQPSPIVVAHPTREYIPFLTQKDAEFIVPFLKSLSFINNVTYGNDISFNSAIKDISDHDGEPINTFTGDIRQWYFSNSNAIYPKEYWKPIFFVTPDYRFKDKVLFTLTSRYVNCYIDFNRLKPYKDKMVFLGIEKEYNDFCQKYFEMEFAGKFDNLLEVAQVIAGAKGYMANPTGLYAIAEGLKVPRALVACDYIKVDYGGERGEEIITGPVNVLPLGGINKLIHTNFDLTIAADILTSL